MSQRDYVSRGQTKKSPKSKSKTKKPARAQVQQKKTEGSVNALPWIRVAAVLVILLGFAYALWSIKDNAPEPDNQLDQPKVVKAEDGLPELPEEEWQYIKTLPGYEVEVDAEEYTSDLRYMLRCASFRTRSQAEQMKATIAFQGLEAQVTRTTGSNGEWFRVILGPFDTKREAERNRHALRKVNITTCIITALRY